MASDKKLLSSNYKKIRSFKQIHEKLSQRLKYVIEDDSIREKELKAFNLLVYRQQFLKGSAKVSLFAGLAKSGLVPTAWGQVNKELHVDPQEVGLTDADTVTVQTPAGLTLNGELFQDVSNTTLPTIIGPASQSGGHQGLHTVLEGFQPLPKIQSQLLGVDSQQTPLENTFADIDYHYGPIEFMQFSSLMCAKTNNTPSELDGITYFQHQAQTPLAKNGQSITQGFQEILIGGLSGYNFNYGLDIKNFSYSQYSAEPYITAITHSLTNKVQANVNNQNELSVYGAWSVFVRGAVPKQFYLLVRTSHAEISLQLQDSLSAEKQSTIGDWKILPLYDVIIQRLPNSVTDLNLDARTYYDINGQGFFFINCTYSYSTNNSSYGDCHQQFLIYTDLQGNVHIVPVQVMDTYLAGEIGLNSNLLKIGGFNSANNINPFQKASLDLVCTVLTNSTPEHYSVTLVIDSEEVGKKISQGVTYLLYPLHTLDFDTSDKSSNSNYVVCDNSFADLRRVYQISFENHNAANMVVLHNKALAIVTNVNAQGVRDGGWYIAKQDFAFAGKGLSSTAQLNPNTLYGGCSKYGRYFSNTGTQRLFRFYCSDTSGNLYVLRQSIDLDDSDSKYGTPITTTLSGYGITVPEFSFQSPGDGSRLYHSTSTILTKGKSITVQNTTNLNAYMLVFQESDGNLVLYNHTGQDSAHYGTVIWSANIANKGGANLIFQNDGNLVVYNEDGTSVVWSSNTSGNNTAQFYFQSDGNIVIADSDNNVIWSRGTKGNNGANLGNSTPQGNYDASHLGDDYSAFYALHRFSHDSEFIYTKKDSDGLLTASICYNKYMESSWQEEFLEIQTDGIKNARCFEGYSATDQTQQVILSTGQSILVQSEGTLFYRLTISSTDGGLHWQKIDANGGGNWQHVWSVVPSSNASERKLYFTQDGNLVFDNPDIWSSKTTGNNGALLYLQASDGNLVIRDVTDAPIWCSSTGTTGLNNVQATDVNSECFYHTSIQPVSVYGNTVSLTSTQFIEVRSPSTLKILCDHTRSYHLINRTTSALLPLNPNSGKLTLRVPAHDRLHCSLLIRIVDVKDYAIGLAEQAFLSKLDPNVQTSGAAKGAITPWMSSPLALSTQQLALQQDSSTGDYTYTNKNQVASQNYQYNSTYVSAPDSGNQVMSQFVRSAASKLQQQPTQINIQSNNLGEIQEINPLTHSPIMTPISPPSNPKDSNGFNPYGNHSFTFDPNNQLISVIDTTSSQYIAVEKQILHFIHDFLHKCAHLVHHVEDIVVKMDATCLTIAEKTFNAIEAVGDALYHVLKFIVNVLKHALLFLLELYHLLEDIANITEGMQTCIESYCSNDAIQNCLVTPAIENAKDIASLQQSFDNSMDSFISKLGGASQPKININILNSPAMKPKETFVCHPMNKILSFADNLLNLVASPPSLTLPSSYTNCLTDINNSLQDLVNNSEEAMCNAVINMFPNMPMLNKVLAGLLQSTQSIFDDFLVAGGNILNAYSNIDSQDMANFLQPALKLPCVPEVALIAQIKPIKHLFALIKKITKIDLISLLSLPLLPFGSFIAAMAYCVGGFVTTGHFPTSFDLPNYGDSPGDNYEQAKNNTQFVIYGFRVLENSFWGISQSSSALLPKQFQVMFKTIRVANEFILNCFEPQDTIPQHISKELHCSDFVNKICRFYATLYLPIVPSLRTTKILTSISYDNILREVIQVVINLIDFCQDTPTKTSELLYKFTNIVGEFSTFANFPALNTDVPTAQLYLDCVTIVMLLTFFSAEILEGQGD
ncbi:MAG: hypothetical protein AAGA27_08100 [Pseudomonadota bacterium]